MLQDVLCEQKKNYFYFLLEFCDNPWDAGCDVSFINFNLGFKSFKGQKGEEKKKISWKLCPTPLSKDL
jgi:hypothetical protein